jgi:iron-sulfur cluster repair protein YtfE (RIC family)
MKTIDRLKRDHAILQAKLDVLDDTLLRMGTNGWYVLREVCFTLARQLQDHIRREEELIIACGEAVGPSVLAKLSAEHRKEPRHLHTINKLFVSQMSPSLKEIKPVLTRVIYALRRHIAQEETELFPILERAWKDQEPAQAESLWSGSWLKETMTLNQVVQQCPKTRSLFERFFINMSIEGSSCLDEVAWRHGMDVQDLLKPLEELMSSCVCAEDAPDIKKPLLKK